MDNGTQTEMSENERRCTPNDAVAISHATADSATQSSAASSTALPLSTSSAPLPTPALPTAGTYSIPTTRNCITPDAVSGGTVAARDVRGYSLMIHNCLLLETIINPMSHDNHNQNNYCFH